MYTQVSATHRGKIDGKKSIFIVNFFDRIQEKSMGGWVATCNLPVEGANIGKRKSKPPVCWSYSIILMY